MGVPAWGDAESAPEVSVEVTLVDESGEGGGCHRRDAGFEEASGACDALADLEGMGWHAGDGSEVPDEVELGGAGRVREFLEGHVLGEVVVQIVRRHTNCREVGSSLRVPASYR